LVETPTSTLTPTPAPNLPPATGNLDLFWALFLGAILTFLAIIAVWQYVAYNRDLAEEVKRFRPLRWLSAAWKQLKAALSKANKSVGAFIQSSIQRLRNLGADSSISGEWDYVNLRRLNPRQKIFFYYLALVKKSEEAGIPRQHGQTLTNTPLHYLRLDEGKDGVEALTESFVEARYSQHDIPTKEARRIKSIWETVRRGIRNIRKSRRDSKTTENK